MTKVVDKVSLCLYQWGHFNNTNNNFKHFLFSIVKIMLIFYV